MRRCGFIIIILLLTACKSQQLAVVKSDGKYGCIGRKGNIVIQPTWDYILQGDKNKQLLVEKDSLYGFIDSKGRILIKPQFKEANLFSEGLAAVSDGKKYGFINLRNETVIPFKYDDAFYGGFSHGLCDVTIDDSTGYIDTKGNIVIPLIYQNCFPFKSNIAEVLTFNGERLLIRKDGKVTPHVGQVKDKELYRSYKAYPGSIQTTTGQGRINLKGDTVVPPIYKVIGNLINGMYIVQDKAEKWGAYNDRGKLVIEPKFDAIWHYYEGLANFKLNGKWGYVDKQGKVVIAPKFDYGGIFHNGLAYVEVNNKSGYINQKGKFVIEPTFEINPWKSNFW